MNLVNLILASALSAGFSMNVKPSFDHANKKENEITTPLKANNNIYNFSTTFTRTYNQDAYIQTTEGATTTIHRRYTAINNALSIKAEQISQTTTQLEEIEHETAWRIFLPQTAQESTWTNLLFFMEITPYRYINDSELKTTLATHLYLEDYFTQGTDIFYKITTYTSTNNYWQKYIDQTTTNHNQQERNQNIINDLLNVSQSNTFNKQEQIKGKDSTSQLSSNLEIEQNIEIPLILQKENTYAPVYVYMYIQPYSQQQWFTDGQENKPQWQQFGKINENQTTITGTAIPPPEGYEVIDIGSLFWDILTMPFAFISQAFNLTLFPGTPYQFNVSNLLLVILGSIGLIIIIGIVIKVINLVK